MGGVTLAQTRGPVKRALRGAGMPAAWPARHGSGSLREPPLASPRAAHRAAERAAGPRRAVSDDRAGEGPRAACVQTTWVRWPSAAWLHYNAALSPGAKRAKGGDFEVGAWTSR